MKNIILGIFIGLGMSFTPILFSAWNSKASDLTQQELSSVISDALDECSISPRKYLGEITRYDIDC